MNNKLYLAFGAGLILGIGCGWLITKDRYAKLAQEEVEDVKATFKEYYQPTEKVKKERPIQEEAERRIEAEKNKDKPSIMEYSNMLKKEGYHDYSGSGAREEKKEMTFSKDVPYVISPDEFGDNEDYEKISYTYYNDGVVTDETGEVVTDVGEVLGEDFADHFGDYEEDSVHIRNDILGCDYEVLYDDRSYSEVT